MSEEEKKAITYLKFYIERDVMYEDTHYEQIKTILNLIEKQQKEIEELKKPKYIINCETGTVTPIHNNFISKDKIREIIKEIENEHTGSTRNALSVLQELLEE